jgi:diguanylate cyclase (GGDEF)-like protein
MENNTSKEIYKILNEGKDIATTYPNKSYTMCEEAYHMSRKNNLKLEEGYALIGMSLACRAKSEINKMLDYSYNALEIFEVLQVTLGQIKSLNLIGIAYFYNSMYEEALKYLLRALDLLEEFKDDFLLSSVLNNVGEVFRESVKCDRALEYYYRALKICTDINSKINTASLLSNIGEIYFIENKHNEALEYFTKSYDILIEEKDMVTLGEVENKLGKIHYTNGNYNKASEYLFSALRRLDNVENKFYAIDVLVNIAKLQLKKNWNKSFYYFEKAIQYAEETNAKKKLSVVCKIVADYYEKTGDFRAALEYFKKYHRVDQEIMTSIIGNKLEILKIELGHLKENHKFEKTKIINQRLEMEISNHRNELEKIQKLNKVLEKKTLEDELTGVPNRSYINYHLNKNWEESLLYDPIIALFIIDIDNFKKYNDHWGHLEGDKCLIKVANCLKDIQVKRKDIFGRYGGEEFIYYAKDINYDQALEVGNLIRNEVEKLCLKYTVDNKSSVVTISVGGAFGKLSNFNNVSNMIEIADKELYKAKDVGRNSTFINSMIK